MDPLAGWTVAVTARRRAEEQASMLRGRGAAVLLAPTVQTDSVAEELVHAATVELLRSPPDLLVASTAVGMRAWIALAWSWGLGGDLLEVLEHSGRLARGAKAAGALAAEGLAPHWRATSERLDEVGEELLRRGVKGQRIAVQVHGTDTDAFIESLRGAGAEVLLVPTYRCSPFTDDVAARRLAAAVSAGEVDAVTFTSPVAVEGLAAFDNGVLLQRMMTQDVLCACVGPVTAEAAERVGLVPVAVAAPARLGALVRVLGEHLVRRATFATLDGVAVRFQGGQLEADGSVARLTPRERTLLKALISAKGAVVSKAELARLAWDADVEEHTVEVTVNRLRRKLGPAQGALETTNRRGYRLAAGPGPTVPEVARSA